MAKRVLKKSRRNQKIYKMKGCSKNTRRNKSYLGGSGNADVNLAYTGTKMPTIPNPFLAYTGKGGLNINASDKTIPNTGPLNLGIGTYFLNPNGAQRGGSCNCGMPLLTGGNTSTGCGPLCALGFMVGGKSHRVDCHCSDCKKMRGGVLTGGNAGIPYPNGLTGSPWTPSTNGWPGVDGVQGGRNYIAHNNYPTDVQTSIISTGANPPFSIGGGKGTRKKRQHGGTTSNFLAQDLINLGRQFNYGLGSAYNTLAGYSAPSNPMPWKGQLPTSFRS